MNINNNLSPPCSTHPLVQPLIEFHKNQFLLAFKRLPSEGQAFEVARRIVVVVLSPVIYLGLGVLALIGVAAHCFMQKKNITRIDLTPAISVNTECSKVQKQMVSTIDRAASSASIQSVKLFVDITCDGKTVSKTVIINKEEGSLSLDHSALSQAIHTILAIPNQQAVQRFSCKWAALVKDSDSTFHGAEGSQVSCYKNGEYSVKEDDDIGKNIHLRHAMSLYSTLILFFYPKDIEC